MSDLRSPTRADFMEKRVNFSTYYRAILTTAGMTRFSSSRITLERVREALKTDPHLNNIPLVEWEGIAGASALWLSKAFKLHGDFWSIAGGVCAMKVLACWTVEREMGDNDDLARREWTMQQGMAHGVDGYNEAMGWDTSKPENPDD
jgi:hypothetical protein